MSAMCLNKRGFPHNTCRCPRCLGLHWWRAHSYPVLLNHPKVELAWVTSQSRGDIADTEGKIRTYQRINNSLNLRKHILRILHFSYHSRS